ncbi:MAG: SLC13 family permease, partial [Tepidisphaerales bacterium]
MAVAAAVLVAFLFTDWPREVVALVAAGVLLLSRRLHSAEVMGLVDWPLLLLFIGLFIVNHGFEATGLAAQGVAWLAAQGLARQVVVRSPHFGLVPLMVARSRLVLTTGRLFCSRYVGQFPVRIVRCPVAFPPLVY